eukprot:scaffold11656_cov85-Skeletonema_dohrnii-CCMP3373.AAC.2
MMIVQAYRYLLLLLAAAAVLTAGKGDDSEQCGVYNSTDSVMGSFACKSYQSWPAIDESSNESKMKKHSHSGKGTITYDNGDVYEGKFRNSEPHGIGMTYKDGRVCKGIWWNGKIEYEGDLVNGKPHGRGKWTYSNGAVYEGEWKNGKKHGKGKWTYSHGTYEGEFRDGLRHGKGKHIYLNVAVHEGDWKDDKNTARGHINGMMDLHTRENSKTTISMARGSIRILMEAWNMRENTKTVVGIETELATTNMVSSTQESGVPV